MTFGGDILDEITEYADDCLSGKIISGQKHKWACMRLLDNVRQMGADPAFPYGWDEQGARNIVDWFKLLRHTKGVLAGQPIELTAWQKFFLCQIYGWKLKETWMRRFLRSFTEVGRKNAKSQMEAGTALYEISVQATKNGEIAEAYTAGTKRDQSKIVFDEAQLMLKGSDLRPKFKLTTFEVRHIKTGSFLRPLNKEDGRKGDGTNPALLIIDEYHQHPTTEFYDLALGSNTKEPLTMIITTAGVDLNAPCYVQEYVYCSNILNPDVDVDNDRYFVDIMELDPEDYEDISKLEDRRLWGKANPIRTTYEKGRELLEQAYSDAKGMPEKMTIFLTKCMDVWVQATDAGYMDMSKWKACEVAEYPIDVRGSPVYVGFDLSARLLILAHLTVMSWINNSVNSVKPKYY